MGTPILNRPTKTFQNGPGPVKCPHINVDKTKELIINGNNLPMSQPLSLNDQPVEVVKCFKDLGTQIDDKLSFTKIADCI